MFPSHPVQVHKRQTVEPDIYDEALGGIGSYDFFKPLHPSIRVRKKKAEAVDKVLDNLADKRQNEKIALAKAKDKVLRQMKKKGIAKGAVRRVKKKLAQIAKEKESHPVPPLKASFDLTPMIPEPLNFYVPKSTPPVKLPAGPKVEKSYQVSMDPPPIAAKKNLFDSPDPMQSVLREGTPLAPEKGEQNYIEFESVPGSTSAFDKEMFQVVDDFPAPIFKDADVPADQLSPQPQGIFVLTDLDLVPPPGYNTAGDPKGVIPIEEGPTGTAEEIDKQIRPPQLIESEEIGFPYRVGEDERYAGDVKRPMPHDASVVPAKPWQEFTAEGFNINPFADITKEAAEKHGVVPTDSGMGLWPGEKLGAAIPFIGTAISQTGKTLASELNNEIDMLEMQLGEISGSVLTAIRNKYAIQRTTVKTLWDEISNSPNEEYAKAAAWIAAARYYKDKLEEAIPAAKKSIAKAQEKAEGVQPEEVTPTVVKAGLGIGVPLLIGGAVLGGILLLKKK
jgi:hypothetical protein